jgi:hypothetical protein
VSDSGPHQFDAAALRDDVRLISRLFGTSGGKMIGTGFGEDPCGTSMLTPRVVHGNPADPDAFADALLSMAAEQHRNVYVGFYAANEDVKPGLKGSEDEVRAVVGVVAEFDAKNDPRAGDWANRCPAPPTMVIESSAVPAPSVQCRFLFSRPASPEQSKRIAVMLAEVTGADPVCKDICHVWRPAGLLNWPNRNKVKAGRPLQPQPVRVIVPFDAARLIDPDTFEQTLRTLAPAPKVVAQSSAKAAGAPEFDTTNPPRTPDLAELDKWKVPNWCRVVIARGTDPDEPTRYPSRSEALFGVVCELTRCGVPREVIFGIITDPTWSIAGSVTDKGSDAVRYALRQLDRAADHAVAPELVDLNDKHFVVENYGGKCVVGELIEDNDRGFSALSVQDVANFRHRYMNRSVQVGTKTTKGGATIPQEMPLGEWWLRHTKRRQFERVVFAPNREVPGCYNLWRGFALQPSPGECKRYLDHLRGIVCRDDGARYEYLLNWMARTVQRPGETGQTAIVMRGVQGCGKGTAIEEFGLVFGRHYMQVSDERHLTGNFNFHRRDVIVLFADECLYAGNKKHRSLLKALITEKTMIVEGKGRDAEKGPNYTHLMMSSNEGWCAPVELGDRRFFMLDVAPARVGDWEYFDRIRVEMVNGGRAALLHLLLNRDISEFNVWDKPFTAEGVGQIVEGLEGADQLWHHLLSVAALPKAALVMTKGVIIDPEDGAKSRYEVPVGSALVGTADIVEWAKAKRDPRWHSVTVQSLGRLLGHPQKNHVGSQPGMGFRKGRIRGDKSWYWVIPPIAEARAAFDLRLSRGQRSYAGDWEQVEAWRMVPLFPDDREVTP